MNPDPGSLDRLHDIVAPDAVGWLPLAQGWWWLAALLLGTLAWLTIELVARWKQNRYRREALAELSALGPKELAQAAELIRRTALSVYPRSEVAGLAGEAWLGFLDRTGRTTQFTAGPARAIAEAAYAPPTDLSAADQAAVLAAVRHWIERHHGPAAGGA